ncbi:MAG: alpha/beta hydrolase fold domain-containing protein [Litorimonas sp.]
MVYLFQIVLTVTYLTAAVAGAVHMQWPRAIRGLSFAYFGWSLVGQIWAFWFILAAGVLLFFTLTGPAAAPWMAILNVVSIGLFFLTLKRAWDSSQALAAVGPDRRRASFIDFVVGAVLPFRPSNRDVKRTKNISYGPFGRRNRLDIYKSKIDAATMLPVLIHVHGGGWVVGRKHQQAQPLIQYMASHGWLVVDINYRLGPWNRMPVMIQDVMRAIAWVKANIADYGGDPNFVALTGGSAGGHLVALAGLASDEALFKPGFENEDCSVNACVPVYGVYDFLNRQSSMTTGFKEMETFLSKLVMPGPITTHRDLWDKSSPMAHIKADAPPMLILHSRQDALADFDSAKAFAHAIDQVSDHAVVFAELPNSQHAYDISYAPPTPEHVRVVHHFLEEVRARMP